MRIYKCKDYITEYFYVIEAETFDDLDLLSKFDYDKHLGTNLDSKTVWVMMITPSEITDELQEFINSYEVINYEG